MLDSFPFCHHLHCTWTAIEGNSYKRRAENTAIPSGKRRKGDENALPRSITTIQGTTPSSTAITNSRTSTLGDKQNIMKRKRRKSWRDLSTRQRSRLAADFEKQLDEPISYIKDSVIFNTPNDTLLV